MQNTSKTQLVNQSNFVAQVVQGGEVKAVKTASSEYEVLILAKRACQTIMYGGLAELSNCTVRVRAGQKSWLWSPANGNILVGQNGTRDWLIWKSFAQTTAQTQAVGL